MQKGIPLVKNIFAGNSAKKYRFFQGEGALLIIYQSWYIQGVEGDAGVGSDDCLDPGQIVQKQCDKGRQRSADGVYFRQNSQ